MTKIGRRSSRKYPRFGPEKAKAGQPRPMTRGRAVIECRAIDRGCSTGVRGKNLVILGPGGGVLGYGPTWERALAEARKATA